MRGGDEDQQSRLLLELRSLLLPARPSRAVTPAGFASFLLGASLAMVLGGSMTFLIGFFLLPWVIGLVLVLHLVGVVSNLSGLGRAILCRSAPLEPQEDVRVVQVLALEVGDEPKSKIASTRLRLCPEAISITNWLINRKRLLTKDSLLAHNAQIDPVCLLCDAEAESHDHLFNRCPYTVGGWRRFLALRRLPIIPIDFCPWLIVWQGRSIVKKRIYLLLMIWKWKIWHERNLRCFEHKARTSNVLAAEGDAFLNLLLGSV
ncbi:hypothetical protein Cni_G24669 [Canna indica]|uniref:Reverse transcriptase zinc-binding domain-containing protein n=1 Tax=Canna indica TaxID=4628 RepID=A0AAQ3KVQ7_9LILI|nr:hypothetical protein Cni_G24669 [Canna indica]